MNPFLLAGIITLFGGMIAARLISERAQMALTKEEKLALLDGFSKYRSYSSLPLIAVVFLFLGLRYLPWHWVLPAFLALSACFAAYMVWLGRYLHRRLRELQISDTFARQLRKAQWCSRTGWALFFAAMLYNLLG